MSDNLERARHALDLVGQDPDRALHEAESVVSALPRPSQQDDVLAVVLAERAAARCLRSMGNPTEAERRVRRGVALADRAGAHEAAAEARLTLAFILLDMGRPRAALAATDHALSATTGFQAAGVRVMRALVLERSGRSREAFAEYDAAWPVIRKAGDKDWEARLRHNRALLAMKFGDTRSALEDLRWTREYDLSVGHTLDAADALCNMAVALGDAGDVPGALDCLDHAEAEWGDVERPERWLCRADVLVAAGLPHEAAAQARTAVDWLADRGWGALEAEAHVVLALCLLSMPEPPVEDAFRHAARARDMFGQQGRADWRLVAQYAATKATLLDQVSTRDLDRTVEVASLLLENGYSAHSADLRATAGRRAADAGHQHRARTALGPLAASTHSTSLDVRSRAWFARALLARLDGDLVASGAHLRAAWKVVETQRAMLGATELRAAAATHAQGVVALGLDTALTRGSAAAAFEWAERGRSSTLRYQPVRGGHDDLLTTALTRLRASVRAEWEARLEGDRGREAARARRLAESDVVRLTRTAQGHGAGLRPVRLSEVRSRLGTRTFAQFAVRDHQLWVVVVGRTRSSLVDLGDIAPLEEAVDTVTFGLSRTLAGFTSVSGGRAVRDATARALTLLRQRVLEPLTRLAEGPDLVVSPTGPLTRVPWTALAAGGDLAVRITPSATTWCLAHERQQREPSGVLAAAGPGLALAAREVQRVAALDDRSRSLSGPEATVGRVLGELEDRTTVHLAAHGHLRKDNPLFSSLELYDGPLTCYDLESISRVPQTMVLSACSSGAGHNVLADETLGLAWILMALGATTVIAPLLAVPDAACVDLMPELHRELTGGAPPSSISIDRATATADDLVRATASAFVVYGV